MEIKSNTYKIRGMNKDLSYKSFNPNYSFDNKNIRLTARGDNGSLRVSNESGNKINCFKFKILNLSYSYSIKMFKVFRNILYSFKQSISEYINIERNILYSFKQSISEYINIERDILYSFKQLTSSYIEIYRDIYYSNTYAVDACIYESREQYNQYARSTGAYVYETTNI